MASDILIQLQAAVTRTASLNSTGVDLKGTPRRGLFARVVYSAAANSSGSNTVQWTVQSSADNSTWATIADYEAPLTLSTTAQSGEAFIHFETTLRYVRLVLTISGAGSGSTVTYTGDITLSKPS